MNILILLFSSFLIHATDRVPMVSLNQFAVGNTWSWAYCEKGSSQIYSTERYRVVGIQGTKLTFEIWTLYAGKTEYTPSAKFSMDFTGCVKAFSGLHKQEFSINMYGVENGGWSKQAYQVDSTAFEEKFNCNPKYYDQAIQPYKTVMKNATTAWGEQVLFQQLPRGDSQIRGFYFYEHPQLQGIVYEKTFNPEASDFFEMHLLDWSMN